MQDPGRGKPAPPFPPNLGVRRACHDGDLVFIPATAPPCDPPVAGAPKQSRVTVRVAKQCSLHCRSGCSPLVVRSQTRCVRNFRRRTRNWMRCMRYARTGSSKTRAPCIVWSSFNVASRLLTCRAVTSAGPALSVALEMVNGQTFSIQMLISCGNGRAKTRNTTSNRSRDICGATDSQRISLVHTMAPRSRHLIFFKERNTHTEVALTAMRSECPGRQPQTKLRRGCGHVLCCATRRYIL